MVTSLETVALMKGGRTAEETADTLFQGLDAGEFLIIAGPSTRSLAEPRLREIAARLDICDVRPP